MLKRCKWHKCNREFETEDTRVVFCTKGCQTARANWREKRGATVLDDLLFWDTAKLLKRRREIEEEIDRDTGKEPASEKA